LSNPNDPQDPYAARPPYGSSDQPSGQPGADQPGVAPGYGAPSYGTPPAYGGGAPGYGGGAPGYPTAPPPYSGGVPGTGYGAPPPPNYLVWAILSTVLCCMPLGIASIVFAAQVNGKWLAGDAQGAFDSSRKAKTFALWSTILGFVLGVISIGLLVSNPDPATM
jgi:hypothetical protein